MSCHFSFQTEIPPRPQIFPSTSLSHPHPNTISIYVYIYSHRQIAIHGAPERAQDHQHEEERGGLAAVLPHRAHGQGQHAAARVPPPLGRAEGHVVGAEGDARGQEDEHRVQDQRRVVWGRRADEGREVTGERAEEGEAERPKGCAGVKFIKGKFMEMSF